MEEVEEIKEIGNVSCPNCKKIITIKKRTRFNQPEPRRKIEEELYAEKSIQTTLPLKEEEE